MLGMDQYELIRTASRVYGHSISKIARDTGHSRNTIKKILREEKQPYTSRSKQPVPVVGPYISTIDQWLLDDRDQPPKQRHTARRIYHRLISEYGFSGSESNIRKYVREAKARLGLSKNKAFIPLEPDLGREVEVDWGTATVILNGQAIKHKMFCMRSKGSGKPFVRLYPCERQQVFFDGMIRGFAFFGGVFPVMIFDNLTAAVRKILQGKRRKEQDSFMRFRAYYTFSATFCNPGQGHEKGGVEGLVGFARRNFLVPIPQSDSLEAINRDILCGCIAYGNHCIAGRQQTVNELFELEKQSLLSLPEVPFNNVQLYQQKADKYATVIIDKNRYSVPTRYCGFQLRIEATYERIVIFHRTSKIASHQRLFSNNQWQLNPDHYLELIRERPLAFHSARAIKNWRQEWPAEMEELLSRFCQDKNESSGIKDFILVLMLFRTYPSDEVVSAIKIAVDSGVSCSSGVKQILLHSREVPVETKPLPDWEKTSDADISTYGQLGALK